VTYVYFEGDFGRVNVGAESAAPYLMAYAAPFVGLGVNSPNFLLFAQQGGAPTYSYLIGSGDANKLTYFTPRISGFQFGISYTPNVDAPGGARGRSANLWPDQRQRRGRAVQLDQPGRQLRKFVR
jgi:hypothetical protein